MRKFTLLLAVLALCTASISQQTQHRIVNSALQDGGIGFLEFRPLDYSTQRHPLIIFLHGTGEGGNGTTDLYKVANNSLPHLLANTTTSKTMQFTAAGQTSTFVVLSPQCSNYFIQDVHYASFPPFYVQEMLKYAKDSLNIDTNRIYITGLSFGGGGTLWAATDTPGGNTSFDAGIAAIAPVCPTGGYMPENFSSTICANHLPLWAFVCLDDNVVFPAPTQQAESLSIGCGLSPAGKFTYYKTGNHLGAPINAYDTGHIITTVVVNGVDKQDTARPNLYEWFLTHSRTVNTNPIVTAGSHQTITLPTNTVTLSGTATPVGAATITGHVWSKVSGPAGDTITTPASYGTTVTGLVQGTYVYKLTATDNLSHTGSANDTITVNGTNPSPVTNAGADYALILPANSVTATGGATDANGIASYNWSKISGPSTFTIVSPTSATTVINNLVLGLYYFKLTATDNLGASSSDTMFVLVNQRPVASIAGSPITITQPKDSTTLNGSGSTDDDGINTYAWSKISGPSTYSIVSSTSTVTRVTGLTTAGTYVFRLIVTDYMSASDTAFVTVNVNSGTNTPPVVSAGPSKVIILPVNSETASGSATDADGIASYSWTKISGPSTYNIVSPGSPTTVINNLVLGIYYFRLTATDNLGASKTDSMYILVNQRPVANIAGSPITITQPKDSTTLNGNGSTDDDGIASYAWSKISGPSTYSIVSPTSSVTRVTGLTTTGTYVFRLIVTDYMGASDTTAATVNVNSNSNTPPVVSAGPSKVIILPVNSTTASGSASDADGIASYRWTKISGPSTYTINSPNAATTVMSGLVLGIYYFRLTATDNLGASKTDSMYILVNQRPVANIAGSPITITQPKDSTTLNGSGSTDDDGIASYAWAKTSGPSTYSIVSPGSSVTRVTGLTTTGTYVFRLIVTDYMGASDTAYATVNVNSGARIASTGTGNTGIALSPQPGAGAVASAGNLSLYPNPVRNDAVIEFNSEENHDQVIRLYSTTGVLLGTYNWPTVKGKNRFTLKNIPGLAKGLYIIDISSKDGKKTGKLKFVRM